MLRTLLHAIAWPDTNQIALGRFLPTIRTFSNLERSFPRGRYACERSQYTRKHFAKLSGSSSHPPRVLRNTCKLPFPQSPPQTREIATKALV
jgi:hypothetical protein